jgi:hypothetical protein
MSDKHMDLLDNGIDFLRSGIECFYMKDKPEPRDHKYAILHIFAGILLVLKEKLRREHPSLIFMKVEEMAKDDSKTVDFDTTVARLIGCTDWKFNENDLRFLRSAQKLRNKIEHYHFEMNLRESETIIAKLCEFIYLFLHNELDTHLEQYLEWEAWNRVQELRAIAAKIREEEIADWKRRAAEYEDLSPDELESLQDEHAWHPKHNPDGRGACYCPECGEEALVIVERDIAKCTNAECGQIQEVGECWRCQEPMVGESDGFCESCLEVRDRE